MNLKNFLITDKFVINGFVILVDAIPKNVYETEFKYKVITLSIPKQFKEIPNYAFDNAFQLKELYYQSEYNIPMYCFNNCKHLNHVVIYNAKAIFTGAFRKCTELEILNIKSDLRTIQNNAFEFCTKLKEIELPETVEYIGNNAFKDSGIIKIRIPDSIELLGDNIFKNCKNLVEFSLPDVITNRNDNIATLGLNPNEWNVIININGRTIYQKK